MSTQLNLKEIERKAFRSTYEDGLWDIDYGLIVVGMSLFLYHPETGYSPKNIILSTLIIALAYFVFWAGKKFITVPRMGEVRFGPERKHKAKRLAIILGVFVLFQSALVGLTALGWLSNTLPNYDSGLLVVALIGSSIVGTSMIVVAYFSDFPRGYYIAILMALAVFLMIYTNEPIYAVVIGLLIIIPGLVLFVRFLKKYPRRDEAGAHE
jgi:MFS family permease